MFLVEKKIDKNDFEKSLHFEGGGQGQFGKSLHFDFFFMTASLIWTLRCQGAVVSPYIFPVQRKKS